MSGRTNIVYLKSAYGRASASLLEQVGTAEVSINLKPNSLSLDAMVKALHDAPGIDSLSELFINAEFLPNMSRYPIAVKFWEIDAFCAYMKPWLGDALIDFSLTEYNQDIEQKADIKSALSVVLGHHST